MVEQIREGITLEELKQLPEDEWIEVVDGELVKQEMTASHTHVAVIDNLFLILQPYAKQNKLGWVHTDGFTFILSMVANTIRKSRIPDLSFVRSERIPKDYDHDTGFPGAPDLAVEVVSPSQNTEELLERVGDYLSAGTEQIWVLLPSQKQIYVFQRDVPETIRVYYEHDVVEAPTLFPDLKIKIADLFVIED